MAFTHLHVHTEYSLLDGAARIKDLVASVKELGMQSIAITDHGVMFGVVDFWRECKKEGIKPIIGCEVYTATRTRFDKDVHLDKRYGHLILLAENNVGYHNLTKIVSRGFTEGFYYKPRIDKDVLREFSEGIICLSGCIMGSVQQYLLQGNYERAKQEVLEYIDIFGKGNFYLEIQDQGLEEEARIYDDMLKLSKELNVPIVATNDVHYIKQEDAKAHDVLLCIQTVTTVSDPNRMRFSNDQFYLKSENEMQAIFANLPEAIENTQIIVDRCNVEFEFGELHLPKFEAPNGLMNKQYLYELCQKGLKERYSDITDEINERLDYELEVIEKMGYTEYFLIVWDFINYAKENGIMVGPGRGSAAGSIVAYTLKITDIDPIKYNLIFERFLNIERVSMPDIDIDFCYERRQEVIDYVIRKYGKEKVSQIITFGTLKAKAVVRDVGRALDVPYAIVDSIAKAIPFDIKMTIDKAMEQNPELKRMYEKDKNVAEIIDTSKKLEGMPRHVSTHAAGVVISKENIEEYVPLYASDKGVATQFPMTTIEELGLLKMDFLGLRTLTVIRDARNLIKKHHGVEINFENMAYDDEKVYEMIASGNTEGIFQLESTGMTQFMKNLRPDCLEDIIAGISLYRPGPMASIPDYIKNKRNPENIEYLHPALEPILSVTYGCLVYQEQVMQIVRELAGYTYGRSDILRRAMGKKKMDVMLAEQEKFQEGCEKNGISREISEKIFEQMVSFAQYAFNKSHAAAYAVVGYQTAYLKAHYPVEFMAAMMTSVEGDATQMSKYIRNCKEIGIEILPPDINKSGKNFTVEDGKIRFGLMAVKNVGEAVVDAIIKTRSQKGVTKDLYTFIEYQDIHKVNKKALESLIKAGAFDSVDNNRAKYLAVYEMLLQGAQNKAKRNVEGQITLFETNEEIMQDSLSNIEMPDVENFPTKEITKMEKEMLGVYISGHPLDEYKKECEKLSTVDAQLLSKAQQEIENGQETSIRDGEQARIVALVQHKKTLTTKKNQLMAFLDVEDMYGEIEVVVFPDVYNYKQNEILLDAVVYIEGTINFKENETPKILATDIIPIENLIVNEQKILKLKLTNDSKELFKDIKNILSKYKGDIPVYLYIPNKKPVKASKQFWVKENEEIVGELKKILPSQNIKFDNIINTK